MTTPVLPATLRQRPMRPGDAPRWAALLTAIEETDRLGEHYDAADCLEELTDPRLDLAADTCLVLDGEQPVAYQVLWRRDGGARDLRVVSDAGVHPAYRGRGVGSALLDRARRLAGAAGAALHLRVAESNAGAMALAERSGLVAVRWWFELTRDLTRPVAPAALPAGRQIHPLGPRYDAARWDEPLRLAHNAAFADHWGSSPVGARAWVHGRTGSRNFRPACSVAACDASGGVAGYVLSFEYEADTARTGVRDLYVGTVGTLAAWRGRGVAGALLAHVLGVAREQGYRRSSLTVDAHNATGALGVYERAGYTVGRRTVTYACPAG